jgi:hypothetical protein
MPTELHCYSLFDSFAFIYLLLHEPATFRPQFKLDLMCHRYEAQLLKIVSDNDEAGTIRNERGATSTPLSANGFSVREIALRMFRTIRVVRIEWRIRCVLNSDVSTQSVLTGDFRERDSLGQDETDPSLCDHALGWSETPYMTRNERTGLTCRTTIVTNETPAYINQKGK